MLKILFSYRNREKNLSQFGHPINDADPRDLLNQIKRFQPNLAAGLEFNPYAYGGSIGQMGPTHSAHTLPNLGRHFSGDTRSHSMYGMSLPGGYGSGIGRNGMTHGLQQRTFSEEPRGPFNPTGYLSDSDLLRKSFAR